MLKAIAIHGLNVLFRHFLPLDFKIPLWYIRFQIAANHQLRDLYPHFHQRILWWVTQTASMLNTFLTLQRAALGPHSVSV